VDTGCTREGKEEWADKRREARVEGRRAAVTVGHESTTRQ
jgi:hypothetical protein